MASQVGSVINDEKLNVDHNGDAAEVKTDELPKKGGVYSSRKQVGAIMSQSTCKESYKLFSGTGKVIAASKSPNSETLSMRITCDLTKKNSGTKSHSNILKYRTPCSHRAARGKQIQFSEDCLSKGKNYGASADGKTNVFEALIKGESTSRKSDGSLSNESMRKENVSRKKGGFPSWKPVGIALNQSVRKKNLLEKKGGFPSRKSVGTLSNQSMRKKNLLEKKKGRFPPWKPAGIASNQSLRKENPSEKKGGGFPSRKSVKGASSQSIMQKKNLLEKKVEETDSEDEILSYFAFGRNGVIDRRCGPRGMGICYSDSESEIEFETYSDSETEMGSVEWAEQLRVWDEKPWLQGPNVMSYL